MAKIREERNKEEKEDGDNNITRKAKPKKQLSIIERMRMNFDRQEKIEAMKRLEDSTDENKSKNKPGENCVI